MADDQTGHGKADHDRQATDSADKVRSAAHREAHSTHGENPEERAKADTESAEASHVLLDRKLSRGHHR